MGKKTVSLIFIELLNGKDEPSLLYEESIQIHSLWILLNVDTLII